MSVLRVLLAFVLSVFSLSLGFNSAAFADGKFVALGTSSTRGVYYPVGQGICSLINKNRDDNLIRCLTYPTGGSIYNIQALRSGELDVAITRADLAFMAANGQGVFKAAGPMPGLRIIASLYDNPVGIVVRADSDIQTLDDVLGSRINIGNLGSGKRDFSDLLFKVMDWRKDDFESVGELSTSKMGKAFCADEVDVLIQAMGIPAKFYDNMINNCGGRFIAMSDEVVAKLKEAAPFLEATVIPGGMYASNDVDVQTIGTKAVLVTVDRVKSNTVAEVAAALFADITAFQDKHVALKSAAVNSMVNEGIYVPFHQGAVQYFTKNAIEYRQMDGNK